jgi:hypothetical protein
MSIPPVQPKPQGQARGMKRPLDCTDGLHDESQDDRGPNRKRSRVKQPAREKDCDPTIVNLPMSTPTPSLPPVKHHNPVPPSMPATPFPLNYTTPPFNYTTVTTPPTHSQSQYYPHRFPYSSYYFSPTPSGSASPYGHYASPYIQSSHQEHQGLIYPYNMSSTFQPYYRGNPPL